MQNKNQNYCDSQRERVREQELLSTKGIFITSAIPPLDLKYSLAKELEDF